MRFDASQHMKLSQQMKLAPRMIQSMEILQMPLMQLEERIAQELESNVTLEIDDLSPDQDADGLSTTSDESGDSSDDLDGPDIDGDDDPNAELGASSDAETSSEARSEDERELAVDEAHGTDDFDRLDSFEQDHPEVRANEYTEAGPEEKGTDYDLLERGMSTRLDGEPDAKSQAMANTAARPESLVQQLQEQWGLADVEDALREPGAAIIGYIEDDGYLRTPLETIIDRLPPATDAQPRPTLELMHKALQAVQILLEPPGVGARDTRECLLIQADALTDLSPISEREQWAIVRQLIADHLEDLAQNRLPRIVEKTGLSMTQVKQAMERMKLLTLSPGRQLVNDAPGMIVPDAIVEHDADQDRYIAYLNDTRLPNLRINQEYAKLAREKESPKATKEFIRKNLSNAAWLIDAVEQRRRTLLRVINVVVDAQREYFDYGPQALKPLPMTQVAEQLGIHVATVSRAVSDKHLLTPRGVVPLRGFFSGGTQTESGENVSWDAVKAALKDIIDAEDKASPLSDDALADELSKRGIEIARRTVAKYRDQLNVPSARLRKKF
ncbi:MAG: RNA polymerase factor sigma-54 [Phycisphaerales bacterium]|nr:RNA polymerase factor sigma-54 [Phycisphaerales bacterium]